MKEHFGEFCLPSKTYFALKNLVILLLIFVFDATAATTITCTAPQANASYMCYSVSGTTYTRYVLYQSVCSANLSNTVTTQCSTVAGATTYSNGSCVNASPVHCANGSYCPSANQCVTSVCGTAICNATCTVSQYATCTGNGCMPSPPTLSCTPTTTASGSAPTQCYMLSSTEKNTFPQYIQYSGCTNLVTSCSGYSSSQCTALPGTYCVGSGAVCNPQPSASAIQKEDLGIVLPDSTAPQPLANIHK